MFYKYNANENEWYRSDSPILPHDKGQITQSNPSNTEGWTWKDTPPREYLAWLAEKEKQEHDILNPEA